MGTFWSSEDIAAEADEEQQEEFNDLLKELETEHRTQVGAAHHCSSCVMCLIGFCAGFF
jgi:hypothetical protein